MFSADSALAILHTCAPGELEEALRNRPEMIIRLRNVLDSFPQGPGIGTASQSSTAPQSSAATQATASTTTPQPFAQPCMVPGFGGAPSFLMAPGPPPQPAPEAPPAQQATAEARPTIPIRGRDMPHSTPQPEPRPSTPRSPGAWHMDRAGHTWQGEAQHHSRHNWWDRDNWWESWWDQDHRRTASPPAPHSTSRPPRQRSTAPVQHVAHGNVRTQGWAISPILEEDVHYTAHGRPWYRGKRGQMLCAIACTETPCLHGQNACNQTLQGENDRHSTHRCSWCKLDREQARNSGN